MFLRYLFLLIISFKQLVQATPLQSTENNGSKLSGILSIVEPIFPLNTSQLTPTTSAENSFVIHCDGEKYGYRPNIRDCEGAKDSLLPDTRVWTLGERHTGLSREIVPLPYRVMGDRALCYVEPVLIGDHKTAQASLNMIRRAAAALIAQCATSIEPQGGVATNIGKSGAREVVHGHVLSCIPQLKTNRWRQQPCRSAWNVRKANLMP